jgi:hypothetical protein
MGSGEVVGVGAGDGDGGEIDAVAADAGGDGRKLST